ncbi:putative ABC transporter permease [Mediterraneibacter sp.]
MRKHRWVNRGFMHGPMLPLYGSGAVSVLIITLPVRENLPLVFIMGMIGATLLEFFTGMIMESLFHVRYWDYSHLKFNIKGYICPVASLCWGVFSIMMVKVVHIPIEEVILKIPMTIADGLAFVLTVVAAVDFTQSFNEAMDMKKMLAQLDETKVQIQKLQERIRETSEEMSEKLRTAAGEMPGRLRMAAGEMPEKIRSAAATAGEMPGRVRTVAGDVPEKLRMELAELKENAAKELQKILSRSDETHAGAMKQLRRNPTAASSRFKDVLEELKKYTEKDK